MSKIAIIGGGPAGIMCALEASKNPQNEIFVFDKGIILNTLLPTGGGRCNLAYSEFNFKDLAKFYPRGEKFLYSIFSRFSTKETLNFFKSIGVETYEQSDNRIFPKSDSAKEVKIALLKEIDKKKNIKKVFENIIEIKEKEEKFYLKSTKKEYIFDKVVIATGGKGNGQKLAKSLGHTIKELKPALCSLETKEKFVCDISGISLKNVKANVVFENKKFKTVDGDLLFTHKGISGPITYKISSYCAYLNFNKENPLKIFFNLINMSFESFDEILLSELKNNPQKEVLTVYSEFLPKNLANTIFKIQNINPKTKAGQLSKADRIKLVENATNMYLNAINTTFGEEIVTAGGISLDEINSKTMESKLIKNLYFCGEVIDVDGLTGGFNLQNCWSTGYIAGSNL